MHARIASFDGDASEFDQMIEAIRKDVEGGNKPPGLEDATGVMILVDRKNGKTMGITFFADEEGMKRGDEALNQMSPDDQGSMKRTSVEYYEVPIDARD